jgi:signal transduction histidine kinase
MLDKIVDNSVDFSPALSRIDIHLVLTGSQVEIRIANQGPRLPEQMRDQIFQSMVSLRQIKGSGAHLGLGLYVARKIAEYHGGSIRAENRSGSVSGAAFIITLPLSNVR